MRPVDIIARTRAGMIGGESLVAVRWITHPALELPENGFALERLVGQLVSTEFIGGLPGVEPDPVSQLSVVTSAQLRRDYDRRRTLMAGTEIGVALPPWDEVEPLLPLLMFAVPNPDPGALDAQLEDLAHLRGQVHRADKALFAQFWQYAPNQVAPGIDVIRQGRGSVDASQAARYDALIAFYRRDARAFLAVRAQHFGLAKLLGWAIDDHFVPPVPDQGLSYRIEARYAVPASEVTEPYSAAAPYPAPPAQLDYAKDEDFGDVPPDFDPKITNTTGVVGYPPFAPLFIDGGWQPKLPPAIVTLPSEDAALLERMTELAAKGPRLLPTPVAKIRWDRPPAEPRNDRNRDGPKHGEPLLSRDACYWRVEVFSHGAASAMLDNSPALPQGAAYAPCPEGASLRAEATNRFIHGANLPWGAVPLEGWHSYRVYGVDLFGIIGPASPDLAIRLRDASPPGPPGLLVSESSFRLGDNADTLNVGLWWDAQRDYAGWDAVEYRLTQHWTLVDHLPIEVAAGPEVSGPEGHVLTTAILSRDGKLADDELIHASVGGCLMTRDGEFEIVMAGGPEMGLVILRRSAGRVPPPGDAILRYALPESATAGQSTARMRQRAVVVTIISFDPWIVSLTDIDGPAITPTDARIHLHLFSDALPATPSPGGFLIAEPGKDTRSGKLLNVLRSLPLDQARTWLNGSPALLLAVQDEPCRLVPPDGLMTGVLRLDVTAADAAPYAMANGRPGNEGAAASCLITVTNPVPPADIPLRPSKLWALGAADYLETAEAALRWPAVASAMRYEVERALETRLGGGALDDDALLALGGDPMNADAFERITGQAFGPRWTDALPGRVPTRAIYRARAVTAAGTPSNGWTIIALVRVPDVRIAPPPNLIALEPIPEHERQIRVAWTMAGPLNGLGFMIESRPLGETISPDEGWTPLADYLPGMLKSLPGQRFDTIVSGVVPGALHEIRIRAVRHALDPRDPLARLKRRLEGDPSTVGNVRSAGNLEPPTNLRYHHDRQGKLILEWTNAEPYQSVEVRRRTPGRYGFERLTTLIGGAQRYRDDATLSQGEWVYELAAISPGCRALSARLTVGIEVADHG